ncbi:hypothetical protein L208DRAFT_1409387 [Tricholoma matsutake]|nr:hypothetical protein L208DRAFT_1409387 [Tricholoma matsutake 945]
MLSTTQLAAPTSPTTTTVQSSSLLSHSNWNLCIDYSAPQCCHCGYRGSHAPTCPFR